MNGHNVLADLVCKRKDGRMKTMEHQKQVIVFGPPGECLQGLISLNVMTLLALWMDVSSPPCCSPSIISLFLLTFLQVIFHSFQSKGSCPIL